MTKSKFLIQVVPSLSPVVDGIGDYALQLARSMREVCGIETSFIVCDPGWPQEQWNGEFDAVGLGRRSASLMWGALHRLALRTGEPSAPVLLHFSPYGYQKRGCPLWLVKALEAVVRKSSSRLHVAFHELEVSLAKPWSSAYWVPGVQRRLIKRLTTASASRYTNTGIHRSKLEAWSGTHVSLIPNFSNIGESTAGISETPRAKEVVIFGRADQRRWTYERGHDELIRVCAHIGAERIVDIGSPIPEHTVSHVEGIPIHRYGVLPAAAVADAMSAALASFMYYPIPLLTKSGGHALACASGTVPFVASDSPVDASCPGLTSGLDYIRVDADTPMPALEALMRMGPQVARSYQHRSSRVAAASIAEAIYRSAEIVVGGFASPASTQRSVNGRREPDELQGFSQNMPNQEVVL